MILRQSTVAVDGIAGPSRAEARDRKDRGVYYTPDALADFVVELTLGPRLAQAETLRDLKEFAILDPAVGGGAFLAAAARFLRAHLCKILSTQSERRINANLISLVRDGFHGADVDSLATRAADVAVRALCGGQEEADDSAPLCQLTSADALAEAKFKRRWDAILCNPPWGKLKPNVREYYGALDPDAHNRQGEDLREYIRVRHTSSAAAYARYVQDTLGRAKALRANSLTHMRQHPNGRGTGGDSEYYRFFLERISAWSSPGTRIGVIVPIAFLNSEGAAGLRRAYLEQGAFEHLLSFENRERLFPIHGMYRFTIAIYERGAGARGVLNSRCGLRNVEEARAATSPRVSLPSAYLREFSPFYGIIPIIGERDDRALLRRLRNAHAGLRESASRWGARFVRECDMTQHSRLFVHSSELRVKAQLDDGSVEAFDGRYLPVFEGRLIDQFDYRAKAYVGGNGRLAKWRTLRPAEKLLRPHFYMREEDASALTGATALGVRAAYCDIGGHANERTIVAALVPGGAICGNKVPTLRFCARNPRLHHVWVAVANTFVVDWVARRLVSTTLNYFYWNHIPMPFIDPDGPAGRFISSVVDELQVQAPNRRARNAALRAFLDAYVAHMFEVSLHDLRRIVGDFNLVDADAGNGLAFRLIRKGLNAFRHGRDLGETLVLLEALATEAFREEQIDVRNA